MRILCWLGWHKPLDGAFEDYYTGKPVWLCERCHGEIWGRLASPRGRDGPADQ
jgi:hypothetical protein